MKSIKNYDIAQICQVLESWSPERRREWLVKVKMAEHGKNFLDMQRHGGPMAWVISAAVHGARPWSPKVIRCLQKELSLDLRPVLTPKELDKLDRL